MSNDNYDTRFAYIPLGIPNVFAKVSDTNRDRYKGWNIRPSAEPYIMALARKHPDWTIHGIKGMSRIVEQPDGNNVTHYDYHIFQIVKNREALGVVSAEKKYHRNVFTEVYHADNKRLSAVRTRGAGTCSKDMNKMVRLVGKNFMPTTINEDVATAWVDVVNGICNTSSSKTRTFNTNYRLVMESLAPYLMDNIESIPFPAASSLTKEELIKAWSEHNVAERTYFHHKANRGSLVVIKDSCYAVARMGAPPELLDTDTIPVHIKQGVGMLKLVEVGQTIDSVGYRSGESTFYIMDMEAV